MMQWIAGVAALFALAAILALIRLMPLKRVEPVIIRVNDTTGVFDVVPVYASSAQLPETVTRYFLTHYVTVCERFNFATAESDYEECGAFHSPQRNQAWLELWTRTNPASPLNIHKDGSTVRVQVESISFFSRTNGVLDLAHVRYMKLTRQGTAPETITRWIATVQYAYVDPAQDPKIRRWNPLGFKIVDFHPEQEVQVQTSPIGEMHGSDSVQTSRRAP